MRFITTLAFIFILMTPVWAQTGSRKFLEGSVVDSNGFAVSNAEIEFRGLGFATACKSDNRGEFKCGIETVENFEITIRADGFLILRQSLANIQEYKRLNPFRLSPATIREEVVVTALRSKTSIDETPASVFAAGREAIETDAGTSLDSVLRKGVGFSLFRRSGSRTSNPTTQGASLRGVNSSGASRAGVEFDGLPVNDPFGGWVVWSKVPKIAIERIEVLRGSSSSLFGNASIGGAIGVIPRRADDTFVFSTEISGGSQNTFDGSIFGSFKNRGWSGELVASTFQTKGYKIVDAAERGPVDDFANSRNTNYSLSGAREVGRDSRVFGKTTFFGEARNNGTPVQKNRTHIREFAGGFDLGFGAFNPNWKNTRLHAKVFGSTQVFDQNFSAVSSDRSSEFLVRMQRVPAQRIGFSARLTSLYRQNSIVFGVDGSEVRGASNEVGFFGGTATSVSGSGGRERRLSFFFHDFFRLNDRINISGSVRYERWNNVRGLSSSTRISTGINTTITFDDRAEDAVSPQGAVIIRLNDNASIYASAGRSFRVPTLNELYRGFRVGNVITDPNAFLKAERATGTEGGFRFRKESWGLNIAAFRTSVSDAISNITFDPGPQLILRQRQNAGETRSQGIEFEGGFQKGRADFSFGYLYLDSSVVNFAASPELEGLRIPQVPRHQYTIRATVQPKEKWTLSLQGRGSSGQFDDDRNTFRLERYFQLDLYGSYRLREKIRLFASIENLFNSRYSVRLTPVRNVSPPFAVRAGIRWN